MEQRTREWMQRARQVLADGCGFGSVSALHHPGGVFPQFAVAAEGARFRDCEGRDYLDWFLGAGPVVLGHRDPDVQQAVREQLELTPHTSMRTTLEIEVAEQIRELVPTAERVAFGKNGTEVTAAAVRLARAVTGREQVLSTGRHGFHDWSRAGEEQPVGIPRALLGLIHKFRFNDLEAAEDLMRRHGADVAAVVVEPVQMEMPAPGFLEGLRALCDRYGAVLVFDEIVSAVRCAPGGIQQLSGVRPDLTCLAKSLANGLPIAALAGVEPLMRRLPEIRFVMTYRREALTFAAARATLRRVAAGGLDEHLARIGERLRSGFRTLAQSHDLNWELAGHPAILHLRTPTGGRLKAEGAHLLFKERCQVAGVFLHRARLMGSAAHTEADVDDTLAVMDEAMAVVRKARDEGLEKYLFSEVTNALQRPPAKAVEAPKPQVEPFELPACFQVEDRSGGRGRRQSLPGPERAHVRPADRGVELVLEPGERGVEVLCGVGVPAVDRPLAGVTVRYRIRECAPSNARLQVSLLVGGTAGKGFSVHHLVGADREELLRLTHAGTTTAWTAPWGLREASLELDFTGGRAVARLLSDGMTPLESDGLEVAAEPRNSWFRIRHTGGDGPHVVEILEFRCRFA